jgi:hypothetical protein
MKRMICIGTQSIAVVAMAVPLPGFEMLCRRDSGPAQLRTYVCASPMDQSEAAPLQLALFEERVNCFSP